MGLCYSKAGWLETTTETYTDCSELSTSNEPPRWSVDTGDKGMLGTLFYKKRRRRLYGGNADMFSARLQGLVGGIHRNFQMKHSPGDHVTFASFVGTPFVRNLEMHGMDAIARSYAISASKASARSTFLLLQERDKSEAVEVLSPMIKIQTPGRSSVDEVIANEIVIIDDEEAKGDSEGGFRPGKEYFAGGVQLDSPEDDDEIEVLEFISSPAQGEDSRSSDFSDLCDQDIDLGAPYKVGMQRSFFESCFPATGRWASVVNAARQSACCLPKSHNSPAQHNCTEGSELPALPECLGFEIRREKPLEVLERSQNQQFILEGDRFSGSETCSSETGHACVGCCGSRKSGRSTSECETCSSEVGRVCAIGCCISAKTTAMQLDSSISSTSQGSSMLDDIEKNEDLCVVSTPAHGLRVNTSKQRDQYTTGSCSTSGCNNSEEHLEQLERLERVDSDLDAFFSFPSSPSAKVLEEQGSGHIIEEMKSIKLVEDLSLRRILDEEEIEEEELEGPRSRAESPRGGNALSKAAFGSPFPVLGASGRNKPRPVFDKKMKFFSLERANTAALAKKMASSDGLLASSSESYLETSSSSQLSARQRDDWEDYSSDLFEIHDMQPMTLKAFCLPLKKSLGCSNQACEGFSQVESAPHYNSRALKYQVRGQNAVRGAENRAKILREQATKTAKLPEAVRAVLSRPGLPAKQPSNHSSKGISVLVLGLLRRKSLDHKHDIAAGKSGPLLPSNPTHDLVGGPVRLLDERSSQPPSSGVSVASSFEIDGKSIKALSIRDVLERQERQSERQHGMYQSCSTSYWAKSGLGTLK